MLGAEVATRAATQYDETHEWIDGQGRHGVAFQTARFGSTMNAVSASSWTSRRSAPAMNRRREAVVAAAMAAVAAGLRPSHQLAISAAQTAAPRPPAIRSTSPVTAVKATTPASTATVSRTATVNERRVGGGV